MKTQIDLWCIGFILASLGIFWLPSSWLEHQFTLTTLIFTFLLTGLCYIAAAFLPSLLTVLSATKVNGLPRMRKGARSAAPARANATVNFAVVNWKITKIIITGALSGFVLVFLYTYHAYSKNINRNLVAHYGLHLNTLEQPVAMQVRVTNLLQHEGWRWQVDARLLPTQEQNWWQRFTYLWLPAAKIRLYGYAEADVFSTSASHANAIPASNSLEGLPKIGEVWQITARTRPIHGRLNEGGFNYQAHLLRRGIYFTGNIEHAERVGSEVHSPRWQIFSYLHARRAATSPEHTLLHADILLALMVGDRQWLSTERWQLLQETGLAHVMAISGLHLTLVFAAAWWLGRLLIGGAFVLSKQRTIDTQALLFALFVALFYAWLAGFAVATVRAFILVALFSATRFFAWRIPVLRILLRCVAIVLIIDPLAWLDAGFWLSACAVAAIFTWQWRGSVWPQRWQPKQGLGLYLWQLLALEMVLTLALAPLSILLFAGMPWIAPFTNLVFLPIFSILVLPFTLLSAALILFLPQLPRVATLLEPLLVMMDYCLHSIFWGLSKSRELPQHWLASMDVRLGWLCVLLLALYFWPARWRYRIAGAVIVIPLVNTLLKPVPANEFALHVLDVGQGAAIVVQRGSSALVFDAGPGFRLGSTIGETTLIPFLRYHQLTPEWLVISHDHQDHTGGVAALQAEWPELQMMRSRFFTAEGESWGWLPKQFPDTFVAGDAWPCAWGQQWLWHGVRIKALAPLPGPSFGPNNDSCVLQLEYAGQRILLTGDVQAQTELRMVGRYGSALRSDILLLPHHGSRTSSQVDFLVQVKPKAGIVSRGYRNSFQMPHNEVLQRFEMAQVPLYDTGLVGQVSVLFTPQGFNIRTFREQIRPRWYTKLLSEAQK
ncbi:DNA internalization-related competence protein ComEC/Rec2 [Aliidiomarina sp.]|uniref:DNA internalization-related competence protein ComEC/Rec2 n=1 Tax=Aliidiomarina sp. TaxID=1872439 RepID=UPI003A4DA610